MTDLYEYGRALFLVTEERGASDAALKDLKTVLAALSSEPEYPSLLDTPALSKDKRVGLIDEAFSGIDESVKSLLMILCEKRAVYAFKQVFDAFSKEYDLSRGIIRVEAITAVPLSEEQKATLTHRLKAKLGGTIVLSGTVDPSILGGIKLRYSGKQLDGSVKTRLDSFAEALRTTVI